MLVAIYVGGCYVYSAKINKLHCNKMCYYEWLHVKVYICKSMIRHDYVYMQSAKGDVGNVLHVKVKTARSVQTVRT